MTAPQSGHTAPPRARHLQTVPRDIVHRAALAEVFVTDLTRRSDDVFVAAAQLPRSHAFFGDHAGPLSVRYDPMLVMEAARQSGMAVVHTYFGVPTTRAFLMRTFNGRTADPSAWEICSVPAELEIVVVVERVFEDAEGVCGLAVRLDVARSGVPMMVVDSKFSWIPRPTWDALRRKARRDSGCTDPIEPIAMAPRAAASAVGRVLHRNVVVTEPQVDGRSARALLVTDLGHPTLFDHPVDHVPGSLQIEACRQLGWALVRSADSVPRMECVKSRFHGFLELDRESTVTAHLVSTDVGRAGVHLEICQNGRTASEFDMVFTLC